MKIRLPAGFQGQSELIENPEADLTQFPDRVVRIDGFPGYCWATEKPMRFLSIAPHAAGTTWKRADAPLTLAKFRNKEPRVDQPKVTKWSQVEEALRNGYKVKAAGLQCPPEGMPHPFYIETITLDELTDAEYDRLTDALQDLTDMIRKSRTQEEDFTGDGLDQIDWDLLARNHAAKVEADDIKAFTATPSFVIAMHQAASRKNMYRDDGHQVAHETDPAVEWHAEMQNLAYAEHMAGAAWLESITPHQPKEGDIPAEGRIDKEIERELKRFDYPELGLTHVFAKAAAAFRAAGYDGAETGHEAARDTNPQANPYGRRSPDGLAPESVEAAIKRNAMPCYKTLANGTLLVLPGSEQAKPPEARTWYTLAPEKRAAYDNQAHQRIAPPSTDRKRALRPDELKPHELAYVPVSSRTRRALQFVQWMMEELGDDYDPDATYDANQIKRIKAAERTLKAEKMESRDRATAWDKFFEPTWIEGLVQGELPPITPKHVISEPVPFEVALNESRVAVLRTYGWEDDEALSLTVPQLERTARYLAAR